MREPLFHISKRTEIALVKAWLIRIAAIALALVLCAIVTFALTGLNPLKVFATLGDGAIGTARRRWSLLQGTQRNPPTHLVPAPVPVRQLSSPLSLHL